MRETTLPTTLVTRDKISASGDHVSKCLFPKDVEIKQNIAPVMVIGDGNCFDRSVSNSVFGTENHHIECRVRCVYELVSNFIRYTCTLQATRHIQKCRQNRPNSNMFSKYQSLMMQESQMISQNR